MSGLLSLSEPQVCFLWSIQRLSKMLKIALITCGGGAAGLEAAAAASEIPETPDPDLDTEPESSDAPTSTPF